MLGVEGLSKKGNKREKLMDMDNRVVSIRGRGRRVYGG